MVVALIPGLSYPIGPTAIRGFIIAVHVDSVETETWAVSGNESPVSEDRVAIPCLTNFYPSTAIVHVISTVRSIAPPAHVLPNPVERGASLPVSLITRRGDISFQTTAASGFSIPQAGSNYPQNPGTVTNTKFEPAGTLSNLAVSGRHEATISPNVLNVELAHILVIASSDQVLTLLFLEGTMWPSLTLTSSPESAA